MVSIATFKKIAMSFPDVVEQPHFEKQSYRIGKKIFATLDIKNQLACLKLSVADQDIFSAFDKTIIYPVPNKWGQLGWTFVNLLLIKENMLTEILKTAYDTMAPVKKK
ncbi:MAG: MmcQ/YjbR family DNA-binding protein [Bacteroidota bacterium]